MEPLKSLPKIEHLPKIDAMAAAQDEIAKGSVERTLTHNLNF